MKYIRTSDGYIGKVENTKVYIKGEWFPIDDIKCFFEREAYTIDELCDEAVFFDNDNVPHYKSKEGELWYLGASLFSTSLRFGIWTDKGLIYVAKMNKDGELELI